MQTPPDLVEQVIKYEDCEKLCLGQEVLVGSKAKPLQFIAASDKFNRSEEGRAYFAKMIESEIAFYTYRESRSGGLEWVKTTLLSPNMANLPLDIPFSSPNVRANNPLFVWDDYQGVYGLLKG